MENVRYRADNISVILTLFGYNSFWELLFIRLEGMYWIWNGHLL